jgi:hypothetical protein
MVHDIVDKTVSIVSSAPEGRFDLIAEVAIDAESRQKFYHLDELSELESSNPFAKLVQSFNIIAPSVIAGGHFKIGLSASANLLNAKWQPGPWIELFQDGENVTLRTFVGREGKIFVSRRRRPP